MVQRLESVPKTGARTTGFENDHRGSLPFTERSWHPWSKPRGLPGCLHDVGVAMDRVLCRSLRRLETGVSECWSRSETGRTGNELRLSLSSLPEQKHVHEDDVCRSGTAEPRKVCGPLSLRARALRCRVPLFGLHELGWFVVGPCWKARGVVPSRWCSALLCRGNEHCCRSVASVAIRACL